MFQITSASEFLSRECCRGTRVDGFLGSSQRLRRRYKMDHLCFSTPWGWGIQQIETHDAVDGQPVLQLRRVRMKHWPEFGVSCGARRKGPCPPLASALTLKKKHTHTLKKNKKPNWCRYSNRKRTHFYTKRPHVCSLNIVRYVCFKCKHRVGLGSSAVLPGDSFFLSFFFKYTRSSQLTFFFDLFGHQEFVTLDGGRVITPDDPDGILKLMRHVSCEEKRGEFTAW